MTAIRNVPPSGSRAACGLLLALFSGSTCFCDASEKITEDQWPMAAGPHGTWATTTGAAVPTTWSGSNGTNIRWRTTLPESGQSGIAVWNDRLFLTINQPLPEGTPLERAEGSAVVGYCLNATSGKVEWTVELPSSKVSPYSGLFSDNSSATPVTDGKHVWFINTGGMMACYDLEGRQVWNRPFEARTRHNAKQCEPMLVENQLLYVMMREPEDPLARPMRATPGDRNSSPELWPWTFIRAFDAATGKPLWVEAGGTSEHNTPRMGYVDRKPVVFHARGGGHNPPEIPFGFSLSSAGGADAGKCLWSYDTTKGVAYTVSHFDGHFAYGFDDGSLVKLDARSGKLVSRFPLFEKADIRLWNAPGRKYESHPDAAFSIVTARFKLEPTNQTPILTGKYFLFLTHEGHCIGRVHTETGKVEYLQVPVQIVRRPGEPEQVLWDRHIPADGKNSRGIATAGDKRAQGDGWGHVTAGSPIVVNQYVLFSTMIGMTYVVDVSRDAFDESALVSINDLGPAGGTWSLSTPSYARGRIFHRGLKEVVCIQNPLARP